MGESVKIVDLARQMIRLSGLKPVNENGVGDIEIQFTGLCPGEKLYEELLIDAEGVEGTEHPRILKSIEKYFDFLEISKFFNKLRCSYEEYRDIEEVKWILRKYVEGCK